MISPAVLFLFGFVIGVLTGFFGVGGGFMVTQALTGNVQWMVSFIILAGSITGVALWSLCDRICDGHEDQGPVRPAAVRRCGLRFPEADQHGNYQHVPSGRLGVRPIAGHFASLGEKIWARY